MKELYYEEPKELSIPRFPKEYPIEVKKTFEWSHRENPERLTRLFKLSVEKDFNSFIIDLLELQSETGHHGRITAQFPNIKVEIWTHDLMKITEIDLEWARKVNDIYGDYK